MRGRKVTFVGYTGAYVLADGHDQQTKQVLHLVAGSGIVPNYALLKDELLNKKHPSVKHTMVYVNKTAGDVIFLDELEKLHADFSDRFELFHCITRDEEEALKVRGPRWRKGRPTLEWLKSIVTDSTTLLVYACGAAITQHQRGAARETGVEPAPRFMEGVEELVHGLGVDKERYWSEEFG
jgi:ferredoxin-NADP reductase